MRHDGPSVAGEDERAQRPSDHARARREDPQVIEIAAIRGDRPVRRLPEDRLHLVEHCPGWPHGEQDVVFSHHRVE